MNPHRKLSGILVLLTTVMIGCGGRDARRATENASPDAIAEYEAAVAEMEQQNVDSNMEEQADTQ